MGIFEYFKPLAVWLIVGIVTEWFAARKTHEWNPWLTAVSLLTVLFRLYWTAWMLTFRIIDPADGGDPEAFRERTLLRLVLFFACSAFAPMAVLAFRRVWLERRQCGRLRTVLRAVPVAAMVCLFLSTCALAIRVFNQIGTTL